MTINQDEINQNEWNDPKNWSALIYRSQLDSRVFVPKRVGIGVTMNFGHRKYGNIVFLILGIIICVGLLGTAVSVYIFLKYGLKK